MITLDRLTYRYPRRPQPALDQVSFSVEPGQIFGLLGPNGAGKTTLIRILSTLILPDGGAVRVCGHDAVREGSRVRRAIGLASGEERSFYFRLTGYQNLEFFGGLLGLRGRPLKTRITHLLERVGLAEAGALPFMKYSSGMKRKLSLARALLADPPVYLLDEPTSGVDPVSAVSVREIIQGLKDAGKTLLLATHNLEEANKLSDCIGILRAGRLIALDSPAHLRQLISHRQIRVRLTEERLNGQRESVTALTQRLQQLAAVASVSLGYPSLLIQFNDGVADVAPVLGLLAESGLHIQNVSMDEVTLEDAFIRLTQTPNVAALAN